MHIRTLSVGLILAGALSAIVTMLCAGNDQYPKRKHAIIFSVTMLLSYIVIVTVGLLPTHGKILEVKIARIKNEAVNRKNIEKGVETLERIGKKLECKYLGGEECDNVDVEN